MGNKALMLNTPSIEFDLLLRALRGAERMAQWGDTAHGIRLLIGHVRRAQAAARAGCPWAYEFVAAYRLVLEDYRQSLGGQWRGRRLDGDAHRRPGARVRRH